MPNTFLYHQIAGVQCQNNLTGGTQISISYCTHIYMHGHTTLAVLAHICTGS